MVFLFSMTPDDPVLLSMKWAELKRLQNRQKKKNQVDTKASKGRKLRYHVHEKLLNFMAPQPRGTWHESMIEELFSNLLGGRSGAYNTTVQDNHSIDVAEIPRDGLRLFG
jgi:protein AATF/BFR2